MSWLLIEKDKIQKKPDQTIGLKNWNRFGEADSGVGSQKRERCEPTPGYSVIIKTCFTSFSSQSFETNHAFFDND